MRLPTIHRAPRRQALGPALRSLASFARQPWEYQRLSCKQHFAAMSRQPKLQSGGGGMEGLDCLALQGPIPGTTQTARKPLLKAEPSVVQAVPQQTLHFQIAVAAREVKHGRKSVAKFPTEKLPRCLTAGMISTTAHLQTGGIQGSRRRVLISEGEQSPSRMEDHHRIRAGRLAIWHNTTSRE
jgi:hypothetical protein